MNEDQFRRELHDLLRRIKALEERARPNVRDGQGAAAAGDGGFWAVLGAAVEDGSNKRWVYGWVPAVKTGAGYGNGWTPADVPLQQNAYNSIEHNNASTGFAPYGNGVDRGNLIGTFAIKPAPPNTVVWMRPVNVLTTPPTTEYWFSYENGIDGNCPG